MPLHDLLRRFHAVQHDTRTGGEITVRTNPQPSRAVRMPDPQRDPQKVITALCETVHALQTRLAALEQGKFATSGQPATLTVTVLGGRAPAVASARPSGQTTNVRPCPMVQARAGNAPDAGYSESANDCPLASGHNGGYGAW